MTLRISEDYIGLRYTCSMNDWIDFTVIALKSLQTDQALLQEARRMDQAEHVNNYFLMYPSVNELFRSKFAAEMITEDTSGKYSAPSLIRYLKKKGVKVYTFANGGGHHTVRLR